MDVNVKDCSLPVLTCKLYENKKKFYTDEYFNFKISLVKLQFINRASTRS